MERTWGADGGIEGMSRNTKMGAGTDLFHLCHRRSQSARSICRSSGGACSKPRRRWDFNHRA